MTSLFQVYLKSRKAIKNFQFVPDIETTSGLGGYAIKKNAPVHRIGLHMGSLLGKVIEA